METHAQPSLWQRIKNLTPPPAVDLADGIRGGLGSTARSAQSDHVVQASAAQAAELSVCLPQPPAIATASSAWRSCSALSRWKSRERREIPVLLLKRLAAFARSGRLRSGSPPQMRDAAKALLLGCRDDLAVANQASSGVTVERIDAEN